MTDGRDEKPVALLAYLAFLLKTQPFRAGDVYGRTGRPDADTASGRVQFDNEMPPCRNGRMRVGDRCHVADVEGEVIVLEHVSGLLNLQTALADAAQ